ncbi:hypothetical protein [Chachezhania sediminis]|nr:hypothetical protein [Chachezhania sediminis]
MFQEFRFALSRSRATLLQDAAGVLSIGVLLVAGLHLPALI